MSQAMSSPLRVYLVDDEPLAVDRLESSYAVDYIIAELERKLDPKRFLRISISAGSGRSIPVSAPR